MKPGRRLLLLFSLLAPTLTLGQQLDNRSLTSKFYFRHLLLTTDAGGAITQASSLAGSITFDGAGRFTVQGQQTVGTAAPTSASGSGTYAVKPTGFVSLANPQRSDLTVNARLGTGAIVGSSSEAPGTISDLFVAIPAPAAATSNSSLSGSYQVAALEFPSGNASQARSTAFQLSANGQGGFGTVTVTGHASNLGGQLTTQTVSGATYSLSADGSGAATFPIPSGSTAATALLGGSRSLFLSSDGTLLLGATSAAGGHDILFGMKSLGGTSGNSSWQGVFFTAGLSLSSQGVTAFAGSANSAGKGTVLFHRRLHYSGGTLHFTGANAYSLGADGTGTSQLLRVAVGAAGQAFLNTSLGDSDPSDYELQVGIRAPSLTGSGVFVHPLGVVNAASFAPAGAPLAPGEFFSVFGAGMAPQTQAAQSLPLPTQLAGVQVLVNNVAVPLQLVSAGQINALAPFAATGATVSIVVNNNGNRSNAVEVALAPTAPGVFSQDMSGAGPGAVLHSDFSLVTASKPARKGETVLVFLTGLGATSPPVGDGQAGPANPLSLVTANVTVYVGGLPATVAFKGLAPGFAGLYQLNITIPTDAPSGNVPLAIATAEAFHDQVDIAVQ